MDIHYGKPINKEYLEINLPPYVQHDIDALIKGRQENVSYLDCLYMELYGSINAAYYDHEIDQEQYSYLRKKYLHLNDGEGM